MRTRKQHPLSSFREKLLVLIVLLGLSFLCLKSYIEVYQQHINEQAQQPISQAKMSLETNKSVNAPSITHQLAKRDQWQVYHFVAFSGSDPAKPGFWQLCGTSVFFTVLLTGVVLIVFNRVRSKAPRKGRSAKNS